MKKYKAIFENLSDLRVFAEQVGEPRLMAKVNEVENTALTEICGVKLTSGDNYDAIMAEVFPDL